MPLPPTLLTEPLLLLRLPAAGKYEPLTWRRPLAARPDGRAPGPGRPAKLPPPWCRRSFPPFPLGARAGSVISAPVHPPSSRHYVRRAFTFGTPGGGPPGFITDTLSAPRRETDSGEVQTPCIPFALAGSVIQRAFRYKRTRSRLESRILRQLEPRRLREIEEEVKVIVSV